MVQNNINIEKNLIFKIIFALFLFVIALCVFDIENSLLYAYLGVYFSLLMLAFYVSKHWLSTLTLFSVFYSIFAFGYVFVYLENVVLLYNVFTVVLVPYSILIASYSFARRVKTDAKTRRRKSIRIKNILMKKTNLLIATFCFSSIAFILYFIKNRALLFGGTLNESRIDAMSGNGLLLYIMELSEITVPLLYEQRIKGNISAIKFNIIIVLAAAELLITGFRTPTVTMLIVTIIVAVFNGKIKLKKVITLVFSLLLAATIFGAFRNGMEINAYAILKNFCYTGMYNLNKMFRTFPDKHPFQWGYTYFINLIMLKPGPDLDFTLWLKEMVGATFAGGGITPTVIGEFYINFGYPGIYIGMFVLGLLFSKCDRWVEKNNYSAWCSFIMLELASCNGGGIANIYVLPLVATLYFGILKVFEANSRG